MNKTFLGHPIGLSTLFFTEMWERLSYYGMRALLILYMTASAAKGGLSYDEATSGAIYGLYTAGVYLLTLPGGWLADRVFGTRKSIWYGGWLIMLGHFTLAIPVDFSFFLGLIFIVLGTGMLKPNISTIVGDLYKDKGAKRDAGFSIFYMGINIGAFLGPLICGYLGENVDWHLGFAVAGVGMLLGLIQYRIMAPRTLGDIGTKPNISTDEAEFTSKGNNKLAIAAGVLVIVLLAVLQVAGLIDMFTARGFAEAVFVIIAVVVFLYFGYIYFAGGLSAPEKKKVIVIFLLVLGAAMFWSGFEQAGSSLNLFAESYTNRVLGSWEIPTTWFQSVNSMFIIIFAPLFGALWIRLAAAGLNPRTPIKFALGLILLGAGFFAMVLAARIAANGLQAAPFYLILTYFLHTAGELCLSPIGLSTTTKLAPKRYVGQMMGMWFVGTALGNLVAGLVAGGFDSESAAQLPGLFMSIVYSSVGAGIVLIILSPLMNKWMDDIH